jgi:hypothetical protein
MAPLSLWSYPAFDEALRWAIPTQREVKRIVRRILPPWMWEPPAQPLAPAPACRLLHAPVDVAHWLPNMPRGSERI